MNTLREVARHYIDSEQQYGKDRKLYHYNCAELKDVHRDPNSGCNLLMLEAADLLESIISTY